MKTYNVTPDRKSPLLMTDFELQCEADTLAQRVARGETTVGDSMIVIELANRLLRTTPAPRTLPPSHRPVSPPTESALRAAL